MKLPQSLAFTNKGPTPHGLRIPQARVLRTLMPQSGSKSLPVLTRVQLAKNAGFSPTSGTINRVLHGIRKGSSSGHPHKGLLDLGLLETTERDIFGIVEKSLRKKPNAGMAQYLACHRKKHGFSSLRSAHARRTIRCT